jgi:hypothetical protein
VTTQPQLNPIHIGDTRLPGRTAAVAAVWSLGYGLLGLHWWGGGDGFPYGAGHDPAARISILGGVTQSAAAPALAALAFVGVLVAAAMSLDAGRGVVRTLLTAFGLAAAIALALVIPDYRLLVLVAYLPLTLLSAPLGLEPAALLEVFDAAMVNQLAVVAGGLAWGAATLTYWGRTSTRPETRSARAWLAPAAASRWGTWATYVAIGIPMVYALTRYAWALGIPLGIDADVFREQQAAGLWAIGAALASLSVVGGLLTLGLVRPWGEVFPTWLPLVGGRSVPVALAVVPASLMAVLVTNAGLMFWRMAFTGGFPVGGIDLTLENDWAALAPELLWPLWGVALGAATAAYAIRRHRRPAHVTQRP